MSHLKVPYPSAENPNSVSKTLCISSSPLLPSRPPVAAVLNTKHLMHYSQINLAGVIPDGEGDSDKT